MERSRAMEISIRAATMPPDGQSVEVVERKGLGHPDTICDAVAEAISRALCHYYLDEFGAVLHHNVDKVLLVAGDANVQFGGGIVTSPIQLYLGGRATKRVDEKTIPVDEIAADAARGWLKRHLRHLDVDRDVRIVPRIGSGSQDLTALFRRGKECALANDTSCGVGFAPLSSLERTVLAVERALTSEATRLEHPALGEDVKVLGIRTGSRATLTVSCAMVARYVEDRASYLRAKGTARHVAAAAARAESPLDIDVLVNPADRVEDGEMFLTVTGTSAEAGDDGEVGRGNRANGLITPYRSMTMEAAAGKNPVSHVGKLYNVAAEDIARALCHELPLVQDATCVLVSQIGRSVSDPYLVDVMLNVANPYHLGSLHDEVARVVRATLDDLPAIGARFVRGEISPF
jgi:S-adenosylmethionine synthetase